MNEFDRDEGVFLLDCVESLTDEHNVITPTEWAEENRYLPASVTALQGPYDGSVAPYMREITDLFSPDCPIREVYLMKGVQICATTAILENIIGYSIAHIKSSPMMMVTADAELATLRMDQNITPMLQQSGLAEMIKSSDDTNSRKQGKTSKKLSWIGGGYLLPYGALNASKLRSTSIKDLLLDEMDSYPDKVGRDGDPVTLAVSRTKAYEATRKIYGLSTPLIKGSSKIHDAFMRGDQRRYLIPCKKCNGLQELRWSGERKDKNGKIHKYGIVWEMDGNQLKLGSARYLCQFCGHAHINEDKSWFLMPENGAKWEATAKPVSKDIRSYALNALYSPPGMQTWDACVLDWLSAWDVEARVSRNVRKLQVFYNNILGEPFEVFGDKVKFDSVSLHRRAIYRNGQIPNKFAVEYADSAVLFLTCTVDVHKENLAVAVMGWTKGARCFVIEYTRIEDKDCSDSSSKAWGRLREIIEEKQYVADDGKKYKIAMTFIDAGWENELVCAFCSSYSSGVYPILGRDRPAKNQRIQEFSEFKTQLGTVGYRILVDHYKDRLSPVLRREWSEMSGQQKFFHFNAPIDMTDKQLRELTVETRRKKIDDRGIESYVWYRPGNARNELWDLLVYSHAAVDVMAWKLCVGHFGLETVDWFRFWEFIDVNKLYYEP